MFAYSASKAGVLNLTRNVAQEFGTQGRARQRHLPRLLPGRAEPQAADQERIDNIMRHTPMKRFGEPEELIGALLLLVSPKAGSFITGTHVNVDGGFTAAWFYRGHRGACEAAPPAKSAVSLRPAGLEQFFVDPGKAALLHWTVEGGELAGAATARLVDYAGKPTGRAVELRRGAERRRHRYARAGILGNRVPADRPAVRPCRPGCRLQAGGPVLRD